jgi:hypothetical protein
VNVPGTPPVPNAFELFGSLANGIVQDGHQFGQLKPWPGAKAPTASKVCTGDELNPPPATPSGTSGGTPVADAGPDQLLPPGTLVSLTAINNNTALKTTDVTFAWKQTLPSGEALTLKGANAAAVTFNTPYQAASQASVVREFEVRICLVSNTTQCSSDRVQVTTKTSVKDTVIITGYQFSSSNGGRITVTAASNVYLAGTQGAQLKLFLGTSTTALAMTQDATNGSLYTYTNKNLGKQPASITVTSALGGTSSSTALLRRWASRFTAGWRR